MIQVAPVEPLGSVTAAAGPGTPPQPLLRAQKEFNSFISHIWLCLKPLLLIGLVPAQRKQKAGARGCIPHPKHPKPTSSSPSRGEAASIPFPISPCGRTEPQASCFALLLFGGEGPWSPLCQRGAAQRASPEPQSITPSTRTPFTVRR